jgi:intein/homing endonuclease
LIHRDTDGLYVIEPVVVKNSNKFRQAAVHFQKYGYYTASPVNTSAYLEYWREEKKRCLEGYYAEDGDWISGYHYFYLNYCPILLVREEIMTDGRGHKRKVVDRKREFPDFWDSDHDYFTAVDMAQREGKHLVVLKAREKGYSYKGASMLCRNFFLIKESTSYAVASEMEFLLKDGLLSKAWEFMDFIDQNTAWAKKRQKTNSKIHRRASYIITDERGVKSEAGYKSEIMGVSLKNDPDKIRGKRGQLILWEEGGKFPELVKAWQIAQSLVETNGIAFGLMIGFGTGGCLTEGNKVWTIDGNLVDIKDVTKETGIIGFSGDSVSKENITWLQPPSEKNCVKIITNTRRTIECSTDHPILTGVQYYRNGKFRGNIKSNKFIEAGDLSIGNKIAVIEEVPIFGHNKMWEPRVVGWLIGDGSYGKNQQPRISNCEEEINQYIENELDSTVQIQRLTKEGKVYRETALLGYNNNLRELGIYGQTKLDKTLPSNIHLYSKEDLQEFIGGLFDTDGYVAIRKNKNRNTWIGEISISSASESLLNELRFLLQKFGIHGRIRERLPRETNPKDKNPWFEFTIADTISLLRFIDSVKLFPKEKQKRLNLIKQQFEKVKPHAEYSGYRYEEVISIEETGIKPVYNLTAGITHTYIGNGVITHNTEEADYEGLKELFLYPDGYNALPFKNIWDDGGGKCGYFVPDYVNMYGNNKDGYPLMDEDGNTNYHIATRHGLAQRDIVLKGANDRNAIDRYIAEHPFTPTEACLQIAGNIFPKEDLIRHLAYIRNTEALSNYKQVGDLEYGPNGALKWIIAKRPGDIIKYKLRSDDSKKGQIVIWEHPVDNPPFGLYIAACDPYDHDQAATSDSLGSVLIYKRFQNFESYYDLVVAEYTGRPNTVNEFYENARKLMLYYNAKLLYENEKPGLFAYFSNKHCDHLLADQPDIIKDIIKDSTVQRRKGIHMSTGIKDWAELKVRDWLQEEYEPGKKNLTKLLSEPLLEELISYNRQGNFDRVIAFMLLMIFKEELHNSQVKKTGDEEKNRMLFKLPLFKSQVPRFINL